MRTKFLLIHPRRNHKVWFIVHPARWDVTINWMFTGLKHTVKIKDARLIYKGLYIMGFRTSRQLERGFWE